MGEAETQAIRLMCRVQSGWSWNSLTDALNARLGWNVGKNSEEIRGTIQSLFTLKYDCAHGLAGTRLKGNADNGNLMDHLHHAQTNNDKIAEALCILTMLLYNPKAEGNQTQGNASSGLSRFQSVASSPQSYEQIVAETVELILDRNLVEPLFENTRDVTDVAAIVSEILRRIADRDIAGLGLSLDTVIDHFARVESAIGEEGAEELLGHLTKEEGLIEKLIERGFSTDLADFYDLTFRTCPPEKQGAFTKFLIDELQDISEEVWLQALQGESELLKLLISLVEGNKPPQLTTNFADALRKHAEEMRVQSKASDYMREWGGVLLKALTEPDRETWLSNLRDDLMSHGQEEIESVLSVYGDDLIESGVLEETKDTADRTVRGLLEPIVIRQRPSELQWLHNALKARSGLLKKSKASSKRALRERIKKQLEEADEEVSKLLEQIADIVKSSK